MKKEIDRVFSSNCEKCPAERYPANAKMLDCTDKYIYYIVYKGIGTFLGCSDSGYSVYNYCTSRLLKAKSIAALKVKMDLI